jgi:ankyrin repeat protein
MGKIQKRINDIFINCLAHDTISIIDILFDKFIDSDDWKLKEVIEFMDRDDIDMFKHIFNKLNQEEKDINDALYESVAHNFMSITRFLFEKSTPNKEILGNQLINIICGYGPKKFTTNDMFIFLIDKADLNVKDYGGGTPLFRAIEQCRLDLVKILIENKCDIDINAITILCKNISKERVDEYADMLKYLLDKGVDIKLHEF